MLKDALDDFEADLARFVRPYFFIDPDGVVVLTNRPKTLYRSLWPLPAERKEALAARVVTSNDRPMLKKEVIGSLWTDVGGERDYVLRQYIKHSQWSLVILKPTSEIFASRVLGIVVTLLMTMMVLIYLLGRERSVHDHVQMEKRLKLHEMAQGLRVQASTDALTGLSNRWKFDEVLSYEIMRSTRYKTPLSLMLYDIDNFKEVNDRYGHQTGDKVLIQLSQFVQSLIRNTDLLARWGGEEFILLNPGSDSKMAYQAAEKLRKAIQETVFEGAGTITCSFGVAQFSDGETAETFLSRADAALYQAKINGRNRVETAPDSDSIY